MANFSNMPSVSIQRTKMKRPFMHNLSFNLGEICVLHWDEVIPGSTHKIDYGALLRMSTPIAPIMQDIQYDLFSFFCPYRLCWTNWKRFMGENDTGAGAINSINSDKVVPSVQTQGSVINSIADDFGIPAYKSGNSAFSVSLLPFRALFLIYNRWFRNQNVEAPITASLGDSSNGTDLFYAGLTDNTGTIPSGYGSRLVAYKLPDYFTSALPYAQKGNPVSIFPTNSYVPVYAMGGTGAPIMPSHTFYATTFEKAGTGGIAEATYGTGAHALTAGSGGAPGIYKMRSDSGTYTPSGTLGEVSPNNLFGDLSNAVNTTIDNLRFAFQMQKFLWRDSTYGSRYWEILYAHYSVTSPDATLQDPQLLGHRKFLINVQQVLQTTGFTDPTNTNLGTPGANSTTAQRGDIFTGSFCEHGVIITVGVARQKTHVYSQGLNRAWSRQNRTDFYFPVFANLGAQKVLKKEIDVQASDPDGVFGYQEAWAEYRYMPSYNSGYLNPVRANSLDYWTLAENFGSTPTLSTSFLKEDRSNLTRCLVTGASGPDFIASFYFADTCVNPMPLYSIPGFADHH